MNIPYTAIGILFVILFFCVLYRLFLAIQSRKKPYEIGTCKTIGSREIQMDYFAVEENETGLAAVLADGEGRNAGGKIAAKTVVRVFLELLQAYNAADHPSYFFGKAFKTANREILKQVEEGKGKAVASAVMIQGRFLFYAIVGNVKIAVFRNGELIPLGMGHTVDVWAKEKYYQGTLAKEDALAMLHEKRVWNYLGRDDFREITFYDTPVRLWKNDMVVMMSDGIYEAIAWKRIEEYLSQRKNCNKIAFDMVEHVNRSKGETDNASVILIKIGELT